MKRLVNLVSVFCFTSGKQCTSNSIFTTLPSIDAMDESILELHHLVISIEPPSKPLQRFALAMSDSDVIRAREQAILREDTAYCIRVWDEWAESRRERGNAEIQPLATINVSTFHHWLTYFISRRKQNGSEYPPNTLHHLICGNMYYLRQNGKTRTQLLQRCFFY